MPRHYFVTGTDTGVGKTRVAQALILAAVRRGRRAVGMKPIASGCRRVSGNFRSDDAELLMQASNVTLPYAEINPYAFEPAVSPHIAAREAGVEIRTEVVKQHFVRLAAQADHVIVEGAGGWFTPINDRESIADVAATLSVPVIMVVGLRLGCLNHAALTEAAIGQSGLVLAGWIASVLDPHMDCLDQNIDALKRRLRAPCWAVLPHSPRDTPTTDIDQLGERLISE
jgi:dethiobiotin synthetase